MPRSLTCDCGDVLTADDDEELFHAVRRHNSMLHGGLVGMSEEQIRTLIETKGQDAPPR
jgi:predicted small metal-binding protein